MQTFTKALIDHVLSGKVDREVAANAATNRHDFLVALEQAIKRKKAADAQAAVEAEQDAAAAAQAQPTLAGPGETENPVGLRIVQSG